MDTPTSSADFTGLDDWYDMVDTGVIAGDSTEIDAAVVGAAERLVDARTEGRVDISQVFLERPPS